MFRADEWPASGQEAALQLACDKAAGGSLLVEEVASLSLPLQGLLSRLIAASGEGGEQGLRLLVTTAAPLAQEIAAGRFREDLFYQIAVLQVTLPPLAERVEDVPALAAYLLG